MWYCSTFISKEQIVVSDRIIFVALSAVGMSGNLYSCDKPGILVYIPNGDKCLIKYFWKKIIYIFFWKRLTLGADSV